MTNQSPSEPILSTAIRKSVLTGASFWSAVAFGMLGIAVSVFLMVTILHSVDAAVGLYRFSREFNLHLHSNPASLVGWLGGVIPQFDAARGQTIFDLSAWGGVVVVLLILFTAHYRRFSRPKGVSLTDNALAAPVMRKILAGFGHFKDIQTPVAVEGRTSKDFFSLGRILYAPKGQISRLLKGKPADNQSKTLRFFMAHEYAHAVTKDNLVNSAFLVAISIYVFVFLSIFGPVIFIGSAFIATSPMGPVMTVPLALLVFMLFCSSVVLCFHGLLISYIKAREFFADQAAFAFVTNVEHPYGTQGDLKRPDALSALSRDISRYERDLHKQGYSLHARNLLVYFWGVAFSIRTLYILVVPKDWCYSVLGLDAVALLAFLMLYRSLPKRPPSLSLRPTFPWLVTFFSILAVEVSGPGLFGMLKAVNWDAFSNENAQLMGLPGLLLTLYFFFGSLFWGLRKALTFHKGESRRKGFQAKRLFFRFLSVPGGSVEYLVICMVILLFCQPFIHHFLSLQFVGEGIIVNLILLVFLLLGTTFLYHLYKNLFVINRTRFVLVTTQATLLVFLMTSLMHMVFSDMLLNAGQNQLQPAASWVFLRDIIRSSDLSSSLIVGAISAIFYLVLRLVVYWARGVLNTVELKLERVID